MLKGAHGARDLSGTAGENQSQSTARKRCSEGLDIMNKSLPIVLLLAAVITAGAALALNGTMYNQAMQGSGRPVAGAPYQSALLKGRSPSEDRGRRSLFQICQHLDPTTPAVGFGSSGCLPLPY